MTLVVAAGLFVTLVSAGASARAGGERSTVGCTNTSTACLDAVAMSYITAIGSKSPAAANAVRAAPDVQRWENGLHNVSSRAELVAEIKSTQRTAIDLRQVRLYPSRDGHNVFAMYLVDGGVGSVSLTSHVIERIGISHGRIDQIEVVQCSGGPHEDSMGKITDPTGTLDLALCVRLNPAVPQH
jgi:hypothetical protein